MNPWMLMPLSWTNDLNETCVTAHAAPPGRRFMALAVTLLLGMTAAGCGANDPPPDEADNTATNDVVGGDGNVGGLDVEVGQDTDAGGDVTASETSDTTTVDGAVADTVVPVDGDNEIESDTAVDSSETAGEDVVEDVAPTKKLPLPSCAKSCNDCSKCPDTPMCVSGKSFNNDCEAICEFEAYDWPVGYEPSQGKCPECSFCTPDDTPDGFGYCATLKNGAKVTTDLLCETKCLDLSTEAGVNPTKGPCKSKCSFPPDDGGAGCSMTAYQPVCSKKDGVTYQTTCAMQNCDLSGCFSIGTAAKSPECEPTKMVAECPGECYDAKNPNWAKCPNTCAPVCAVAKSGKGVSFRNGCIANAEGAKVLSCTGVSATTKDQCSATLYAAKSAGCCDNVDYSDKGIKQVCYSKGQGTTAQWMTYRNKAEFDCLVAEDQVSWTFQYAGPCICDCPQTEKLVCGDDGIEYQNACQAKCYNGEAFGWKDGPC